MLRPNNPILFNAVTNSSTKTSAVIDAAFILQGTIIATFSDGAAGGTLVLQGSNDPASQTPGGEGPQTWVSVPNTSQTVASGATTLIPLTQLCFRWLRLSWTSSAGAGTINAYGMFQGQ